MLFHLSTWNYSIHKTVQCQGFQISRNQVLLPEWIRKWDTSLNIRYIVLDFLMLIPCCVILSLLTSTISRWTTWRYSFCFCCVLYVSHLSIDDIDSPEMHYILAQIKIMHFNNILNLHKCALVSFFRRLSNILMSHKALWWVDECMISNLGHPFNIEKHTHVYL